MLEHLRTSTTNTRWQRYFLSFNYLVRIEGCCWQNCVSLLCLCLSAAKFTVFFDKKGGTLLSQGIPIAKKKYRAGCLAAKNISFHSLFRPLSNCQWYFTGPTTLFKRSLAKFCHSMPVVQKCAGIKGARRHLSLFFDSPLELCGPSDKEVWWVGNLWLPAAGLARGAGKVPDWVKTHSIQTTTQSEMWMYADAHTLLLGYEQPQMIGPYLHAYTLTR